MVKDKNIFSAEIIRKNIEDFIGEKLLKIEYRYYDSIPDTWHIYDDGEIKKLLFKEEGGNILVYYKPEKEIGWLCSSKYAIVNKNTMEIIQVFSANDEG